MAKIVHMLGLVRSVEEQRKRDGDREVWGARASILTEPHGDTAEVTAFTRTIEPRELSRYVGEYVHITADVDVTAGLRGGAWLQLTLRDIEPISAEVAQAGMFSEPVPA